MKERMNEAVEQDALYRLYKRYGYADVTAMLKAQNASKVSRLSMSEFVKKFKR